MRRLLGNSWVSLGTSNVLVLVLGITTGILAARMLLPEGRGALAAIILWPHIIVGLGILGLNESLIYRLGNKDVDRGKAIASALMAAFLLSVLMVIIGWVLLPYLLGEERQVWLEITRGYLVFFVILSFFGRILNAVDQSELRFTRVSVFRLLNPAIYLLGLIVFWYFGGLTVEEAVYANLAGVVLVQLIRIAMTLGVFCRLPSLAEVGIILRRGMKFHVVVALFFIGSQIDKIALILLWDDYSVGLYVVAVTLAQAGLGVVANVFHTIMYPNIVKTDERDDQVKYLAQGLRFSMLLLVGGAVTLILMSTWLVPFLFGEAFEASVAITVFLLSAYVPLQLRNIIARSLRGLGLSRPSAIAEMTALAVFIAIFVPMGDVMGLPGIACSMLIANLTAIVYMAVYLHRALGVGLSAWWGLNPTTLVEFIQKLLQLLGSARR